MSLSKEIIKWLRKKIKEAKAKGLVVGLSGGVDSSVVGVLSKLAYPKTSLGLIMPCCSNPTDKAHALLLAKKFKINTKEIKLDEVYLKFLKMFGEKLQTGKKLSLPLANLKPRLRMIVLYYWANKLNYLVAGSGNKSELMMGYFTKYGDGGVDLLPLGDLTKTQVRKLAKSLGIPKVIIDKPPSAGLWKNQTDESEMDITYERLDKIIEAIEKQDFSRCNLKDLEKVKNIYKCSAHKREIPAVFTPQNRKPRV